MAEMTPEIAAILRRQFPPEQIGKLPRQGIQLDYVGHADVTSRLLEADPQWTWEPLATDEQGMPVFDVAGNGNPVGLWIKLTIAGVTRLGYGSVPDNQRDAVKVLIGDALRNAAMRFGVAVDLWAKGDRADPAAENPSGAAGKVARIGSQGRIGVSGKTPEKLDLAKLAEMAHAAENLDSLRDTWTKIGNAGLLQTEIAHPGSGEKIPFQEFLYEMADKLGSPKSDGSSDYSTQGNGAAAPKGVARLGGAK